ncbi:MAG: CTP synthase [Candidatus Hydrogenedentota bacterium]|nr:MAG: CTP synthase [Candidatus Hydrogenedentota bacterium]
MNEESAPIKEHVPRLVCLTGGVISSLGKGIAAASLGNLLKSRGYSVGIMKLDPYINVDPGTMSPFQHGEVYVTLDGAETDLDLGHYERFLDENLTQAHNVTTGRIYDTVIRRERAGDYLGKTVQVIPHITDEIKRRIVDLSEEYELLIVEIGGTVGDIESLPFLEAIRQLRRDVERCGGEICYVHLTLVPFQKASGEMKTKPTQHSVAALREIGIHPHVLLCRSETALDTPVREKIALFADIDVDAVIGLPDVETIYEVPRVLQESGFDEIVLRQLRLPQRPADRSSWDAFVQRVLSPESTVRIGIIGKYIELHDAYKSVFEAVVHGGAFLKARPEIVWIDSEDVERGTAAMDEIDGMIIPGGFGERGVEGKILAARYLRENEIPFLGICLGLQCAVIEFARNRSGIEDAHSTEFSPDTAHPVIHIMASQRSVKDKGGTMRLGAYPCRLRGKTLAASLYGEFWGTEEIVKERHRHRFEVNNAYRDRLAECGMIFSGLSPDGLLVEIVEWPAHPFYIACQFHPEFQSRPLKPHPLFAGLIRAALRKRSER